MENVVLMKNSTIKSGLFTKTLREIMSETKEKAKGLWYKAGAVYSSMPTFKLKTSKNPMLRTLGNLSERYGVRIIAGTALAAVAGYTAVELLVHPEVAFAAEDADLSDSATADDTPAVEVKEETPVKVESEPEPDPEPEPEPVAEVDGNEVEGTVVEVSDAGSGETDEPEVSVESNDEVNALDDYDNPYGEDLSNVDAIYRDENGNAVNPDEHDQDAAKENIRKPDPEPEPKPNPDSEPDSEPKKNDTHDTHDKGGKGGKGDSTPSAPGTIPQTGDNIMSKAVGLTGIAIGALAIMDKAKNKLFKTDRLASSLMRMGVVEGRPLYENIDFRNKVM